PKNKVIFLLHLSPPDQRLDFSQDIGKLFILPSFVTFLHFTFIFSFPITIFNKFFAWNLFSIYFLTEALSSLPSSSLNLIFSISSNNQFIYSISFSFPTCSSQGGTSMVYTDFHLSSTFILVFLGISLISSAKIFK